MNINDTAVDVLAAELMESEGETYQFEVRAMILRRLALQFLQPNLRPGEADLAPAFTKNLRRLLARPASKRAAHVQVTSVDLLPGTYVYEVHFGNDNHEIQGSFTASRIADCIWAAEVRPANLLVSGKEAVLTPRVNYGEVEFLLNQGKDDEATVLRLQDAVTPKGAINSLPHVESYVFVMNAANESYRNILSSFTPSGIFHRAILPAGMPFYQKPGTNAAWDTSRQIPAIAAGTTLFGGTEPETWNSHIFYPSDVAIHTYTPRVEFTFQLTPGSPFTKVALSLIVEDMEGNFVSTWSYSISQKGFKVIGANLPDSWVASTHFVDWELPSEGVVTVSIPHMTFITPDYVGHWGHAPHIYLNGSYVHVKLRQELLGEAQIAPSSSELHRWRISMISTEVPLYDVRLLDYHKANYVNGAARYVHQLIVSQLRQGTGLVAGITPRIDIPPIIDVSSMAPLNGSARVVEMLRGLGRICLESHDGDCDENEHLRLQDVRLLEDWSVQLVGFGGSTPSVLGRVFKPGPLQAPYEVVEDSGPDRPEAQVLLHLEQCDAPM